jgi:hypothetical protein
MFATDPANLDEMIFVLSQVQSNTEGAGISAMKRMTTRTKETTSRQ